MCTLTTEGVLVSVLVRTVRTPTHGENDFEASLLLEGVGQEPVEVVALTEHPRVVGETKIFRHHIHQTTFHSVLKKIWETALKYIIGEVSLACYCVMFRVCTLTR